MGDMTNYQKIRIMNKKGFAEWMSDFIICPLCPAYADCWVSELDPDRGACAEQLEAWLDQEAE